MSVKISPAWALACAMTAQAYVGDWTSYTPLGDVRDLQPYRGYLFAATSGGVRRISPRDRSETVYRNTEGLRDVGIQAVDTTADGELWASSEEGLLYRLDPSQKTWEVFGSAYKSSGWKMNKRALLYHAGYLILGSEKGLSFFSLSQHIAEANLTKMGVDNEISANSLLLSGDTLFVGTNHGIFHAALHFDRLLSDTVVNIFKPSIWSKVPGSDTGLFFRGNPTTPDSSETPPVDADVQKAHGLLYYGANGISSGYEGMSFPQPFATASRYGGLTIGGNAFPNPHQLAAVAGMAGKWYAGNPSGLYELHPESGSLDTLRNPLDLPVPGISLIKATPYGVFGWAPPRVYKLQGKTWGLVPGWEAITDPTEILRRGVHAFEVRAPDELYVGTWGFGLHAVVQGSVFNFDVINSCLESATPPNLNPNYPVIPAQAVYKNKGLWMSNLLVQGYKLAYYDFQTKTMSCFPTNVQNLYPWSVQVVGDSVVVVTTETGLDAYRIQENGGIVSLGSQDMLQGMAGLPEPGLAAKMDAYGNFWVATESKMVYAPNIRFGSSQAQSFRTLEDFPGSNCHTLELDARGHLWAGCQVGGVFEIVPGKDSLSHSYRKYGLNDGLLSEVVYILSVNQTSGEIWAVTEKGISRFESGSRSAISNLGSAKVYPNPFLSKHRFLIFDNLSTGSEIQILTQSGSAVYHASLGSDAGGQLRWDGRNQSGAKVKEGVYFYVIKSTQEVKHGKIIVAR